MYAQDHDECLPEAPGVWDELNLGKNLLRCPSKARMANGYVYNYRMSGRALGEIDDPVTTILTADGLHAGYTPAANESPQAMITYDNVAYDIEDYDKRHGKKFLASYADGHVERNATPPTLGTGFTTEVFANAFYQSPVVVSGTYNSTTFDCGVGYPVPEITTDLFSIYYYATLKVPQDGTYVFRHYADDDVQLLVGGFQVINDWDNSYGSVTGIPITLKAGLFYPFRLAFRDRGGGARWTLYWTAPGTAEQQMPMTYLLQGFPR